ncbi:hypothetical protein CHUAL_002538 [Chamberlinius hualienensis]
MEKPSKRLKQSSLEDYLLVKSEELKPPDLSVTATAYSSLLHRTDELLTVIKTQDNLKDSEMKRTCDYKHNDQSQPSSSSVEHSSTVSESDGSLAPESNDGSTNNPVTLGTPLSDLKTTPQCAQALPALSHQNNCTVLFEYTECFDTFPDPWPRIYEDKWDDDHVKMPCSPNNLYRCPEKGLQSRWSLIEETLRSKKISTPQELEKAILTYNKKHATFWNMKGLHHLFEKELSELEKDRFFDKILPGIIDLALKLPKLCTRPIPLLKQDMNHTIFLSQMQAACLLANAFLCTFPLRNYNKKGSRFSAYPNINFSGLFAYYKQQCVPVILEKLKCFINYFHRVLSKDPCGTISFTRRSIAHFPSWKNCSEQLSNLYISSQGLIDDCNGMLQMDFANKYLGGGVLKRGAVQEEIRFVVCPELIVGQLFSEHLLDNECIVIKGVERYSKSKGYAKSFQFDGNFIDTTPRDEWGRRYTALVALDATRFGSKKAKMEQHKLSCILREVNKAYCGFCCNTPKNHLEAVATGNWGCGAFGGDPRLKALLQLIAASKAGRDVAYLTFNDTKLCQDIYHMYNFLKRNKITIGDLWKLLERYPSCDSNRVNLYDYIYNTLSPYDCDTE